MGDMHFFVFVLLLIIGVVKPNESTLLKEFRGHLELTDEWVRHLLKSMKWVKKKGTTGNVEPSGKFLLIFSLNSVKFQ